MINRDFTKSGKQYIKQNKVVLIVLAIIFVASIVMLCVFGGFKGGAEVSGYKTFSINLGTEYNADKMDVYTQEISGNLAEHNVELLSVQLTGEGDSTTLIVKYSGEVKDELGLSLDIAKVLNINPSIISDHSQVGSSLTSQDYIYTVVCGLIIIALATVYIACKYNLACAITALSSSIFGVALLMAITSIFRLTINSSFLAINIITLLLILVECFMLFESIEKERAKLQDKNARSTQISNALKANAFRQKFMYGAIFALSLIFVILTPTAIKQASLIMMFATVIVMFVAIYALPFLWCLTITQISDKIRVKKVKNEKAKQTIEEVEGELENQYTENQVIEVKEDSGEQSPSNDDNITIE